MEQKKKGAQNTRDKQNTQNTLTFSILSAGYILLGLFLLLAPEASQKVTCYLLGAIGIVLGIIRVANYFMRGNAATFFHNDLALGVVLLVAGIYIIAKPDMVQALLPVLLGFAVVFDSMIKVQHSFDLRRLGFAYWWVVLMLALAAATLGLLLVIGIFGGGALAIYFGIVLIVDGILNVGVLVLVHMQNRQAAKTAQQQAAMPAAPPFVGQAPGHDPGEEAEKEE